MLHDVQTYTNKISRHDHDGYSNRASFAHVDATHRIRLHNKSVAQLAPHAQSCLQNTPRF